MLYCLGYMLALLAGFENDLTKFFWGYLIFGSAHLSVSFSNNYFDRHSDKNSDKTVFSGGSKILLENPELQFYALFISVFLLCFSIIANLIFTVVYAYPIWFFIFVLFGGLLGWFYTAPPLKFAYRSLGELSTMLAVGFFMPGMGYFVASGTLDSLFKLIILPLSCYGLFFIITVELPDLESDALANKKNLLVKWGRTTGKFISVLATGFGTLILTMLFVLGIANEVIDWKPFAVFSIFPLIASITALLWRTKKRKNMVKQVMVNMFSMIGFLFLMDITLFFQYAF
jgi:1,4-dihydroxy-2-naphthoate octaprenyltransferase